MSDGFLLDTCAAIWMSQDEPVSPFASAALKRAYEEGGPVYVSSATAWEMAMLVAKGRISETKSAKRWYDDFRREAEVQEHPVTADIFMASCFLPQLAHRDPIDRILIATAREGDLTIVTRDRVILAYGEAGHVKTLAC
jgi:PIN domain nuclease of toxin-antitoxin system